MTAQSGNTSLSLSAQQVIIRPLVTEKGTQLSEENNAYTFEVNSLATKTDIKHAVQDLWNVRVIAVRTQNRRGKTRRSRFGIGHTRSWKKAVVVLHDDDRISFY